MRFLGRVQTGRISAVVLLVAAFAVVGALFALLPTSSGDTVPAQGGPASAESSRAAEVLGRFPGADQTSALVLFAAPEGTALTPAHQAAITARAAALAAASSTPRAVRPQVSADGTAALVVVPVAAESGAGGIAEQADALRRTAAEGLPDGLRTWLTGPVGFQADTANSFAGADVRLLLITAGVVALLLIITYRSPVLWLVPLAVVAVADGLARFVVAAVADAFDIPVDASILGILSVLVFGAGTNYALLLIARYREELLVEPDPRAAMRTAVSGAGPAILASGGTVALSLLVLVFASLEGNRALGVACAIGVAIALVMALGVLPAAIVVCGRGLFWPFVPRVRSGPVELAESHRVWVRIGSAVRRGPVRFVAASVLLVAFLSLGLSGASVGLTQTEQLLGEPEAVQGAERLSAAFPGQFGGQTSVVAPAAVAEEAASVAGGVGGVASARTGASANGWTRVDVVLSGAPQSDEAFDAIRGLRAAYAERPGHLRDALVGGADAAALDQDDAATRDRAVIIPLILVVVFGVLLVLLRSLVAPLILIASVVATYVASLGAGNWLFQHVFGFAAFDTRVLLYAFLFLVALGVDYNIFLATRAREERERLGAVEGMREALTRTGSVITSAGVLLAAVFVVLGVLPVVALAQIGAIVCIGVLLDTLVVRTLLVPALAFLLGDRFWWPAKPPTFDQPVKAQTVAESR
ncbi:MMPL family transporter [Actinokineospora sp. G85]|uniref:MMPL family transporter n=1 Tax=Actinokineospora sp. G85 TaxID=3406626 RepID=UPI003C73C382